MVGQAERKVSVDDITYRLAREQDLERTYELFVAVANQLAAAHNFPQQAEERTPSARALAFRQHALRHDAQRFWVAEDAGQVIGFGVAMLRQHLCYLASLYVLSDYHGRGIGRTLLHRCMGEENASVARVWTTIASSLNLVSNGLYARFGMYQWVPLVPLSGTLHAGDVVVDPGFARSARRLTDDPANLTALANIDQRVLGLRRDLDHRLWLAQPDLTGYLFGDPARPQGYAYLSTSGAIGPLTVKQEGCIEKTLAFCLAKLQAVEVENVYIKVPGLCREGLRYSLAQGLRFGTSLLILASEPFGQMDRYIPSGGDALF